LFFFAREWVLMLPCALLVVDHIITFTREGNEEMGCDVFE
jgi:hypothetical protein